jgi:ATP-binding cassette subfamily B protein
MSFFEGLNAEKYDRQYTDRQLFARIAEYFKPQVRRFIWVAVWMVVLGVILAALPVVVARLVDLLKRQLGIELGAASARHPCRGRCCHDPPYQGL